MIHGVRVSSALAPALFALLSAGVFVACGDSTELESSAAATSGGGGSGASGGAGSGGETSATTGAGGASASACDAYFADVPTTYPDAGTLGVCDGTEAGKAIAASLMNLDGLTIDNDGATMTPCVAVRCDDTFAYVASNALPHYDFVQTTPNALVENPRVYRIPLTPRAIAAQAGADDASAINGCVAAYSQYLTNSSQGTQNEPSGYCQATQAQSAYLMDQGASGPEYLHKIPCLDTTAFVIAGSPIFGPNEAQIPDPFGNPLFAMPDTAADPYLPSNLGMAAALDLCGGHTANSMHYHGVSDACFERDEAGKPARSGAESMMMWDFEAALDGPCTEESGIVGWALDGVPIKGSCVCAARAEDGSCTDLRRVRSAYAYKGLGAWGNDPNEANALGAEGKACSADADCCSGATCDFQCTWAVFDDAAAPYGTTADKRCVLLDYSWCTSQFEDRSAVDVTGAPFVYLDRCNGFEGPDGYAYHASASFPMLPGCYRFEPEAMAPVPGGGGQGGGGGGMLPDCQPGQMSMCCGDGVCDGPETAQNCAADCP